MRSCKGIVSSNDIFSLVSKKDDRTAEKDQSADVGTVAVNAIGIGRACCLLRGGNRCGHVRVVVRMMMVVSVCGGTCVGRQLWQRHLDAVPHLALGALPKKKHSVNLVYKQNPLRGSRKCTVLRFGIQLNSPPASACWKTTTALTGCYKNQQTQNGQA